MKRFFALLFTGTAVSCYYFPFGLKFLPSAVNTKMILAVIGIFLYLYEGIRNGLTVRKDLAGAVALALAFSFVCFLSTDYNNTSDYSYASYIVSFFTWMGGAYTVCRLVKRVHGRIGFRLLTTYLAGVCTVQCILAILIDRSKILKLVVDGVVNQGQDFLQQVGRLYGIGASLDPAGVRFAIVLLMIAALLGADREIRGSKKSIAGLLSAFAVISIIGNMISRTTTTGMVMAFVYLFLASGIWTLIIREEYFKFYKIFGIVLIIAVGASFYLYHHDPEFYHNMRFAFEGFFNWVDTGVWRTDSTDKLNRIMWIWPKNIKEWIIGTGLFNNFLYGTDIGYCRLILYCGLAGFSLFALFFVYNAGVMAKRFPSYRMLFFFLLCLSFIVWLKVATDLFLIYALLYNTEEEKEVAEEGIGEEEGYVPKETSV